MEYFGMATYSTFPHLNGLLLPESTLPGYPRLLLEPPTVPCPNPFYHGTRDIAEALVPRWEDMLSVADGLFKAGEGIGLLPNKDGLLLIGQTLLATSVIYFSWRVSKGWNTELRMELSNPDITTSAKYSGNELATARSTPEKAELGDAIIGVCTDTAPVNPTQTTSDEAHISPRVTEIKPEPKSSITSSHHTQDEAFHTHTTEDGEIQSKDGDMQSRDCDIQSLHNQQNVNKAQEGAVKTPPETDVTGLSQVLTGCTDSVAEKFHSQLQSVFSRLADTTTRLSQAEGERDLLKAELTSRKNQVTSLQQEWTAENEKRLLTELKMMEMLGGEFIERRRQIKERREQHDRRNAKRGGLDLVKSEGGASLGDHCSRSRDLDSASEVNHRSGMPKLIESEVNTTFNWLPSRRYTPTYSWLPPKVPSASFERRETQIVESPSEDLKAWTSEEELKRRSILETCVEIPTVNCIEHVVNGGTEVCQAVSKILTPTFGFHKETSKDTQVSNVTSPARSPPKSKTSDMELKSHKHENCNSCGSSARTDRSKNTMGQFGPRAIMEKFRNLIQGYQEQESGRESIDKWNTEVEGFLVDFGNDSVLASPMDHEFYSAPTSPNINANHLVGNNATSDRLDSNSLSSYSLTEESISTHSLTSDCLSSECLQSDRTKFFQFRPIRHKSNYLKTTQLGCGHAGHVAMPTFTLAHVSKSRTDVDQAATILQYDINGCE